jgi:hypothetical protein
MTGDWRDFRPTIWSLMVAIAVALLVNPWYVAVFFVGAAIGLAARTIRMRRRAPPPPPASRRR